MPFPILMCLGLLGVELGPYDVRGVDALVLDYVAVPADAAGGATLLTPVRARWQAKGKALRFADRVTLAFVEPATLTRMWLRVSDDEPLGGRVVVSASGHSQVVELVRQGWQVVSLDLPEPSERVTLMALPSDSELADGSHWRALEIEVGGEPADPDDVPIVPLPPRVAWSEGDGKPEVIGLPAISEDGRYVVDLDDRMMTTEAQPMALRVTSVATGRRVLTLPLMTAAEDDVGPSERESASFEARIAAANQAMARLSSRGWTPLVSLSDEGLYFDWRDLTLTVADGDGRRLHRSRHARWAPPDVPHEPGEDLSALVETVSTDRAHRILYVPVYYHPGVCPGGGYERTHIITFGP